MATSITTAQQKAISELYVAFFNRAADSEGLGFWAGALASGKSIESVAQDMYLTAPARAYYSTALTNEQFIKAFYATVLNRATPDAEGVAFWTAALNQPSATQGSVAVQIMKAVRDYVDTPASPTNAAALTAKTLFAAKVDVSTAYALQGGTVAGAGSVLSGVVDAATAATAIANLGAGNVGSTFTLTTGVDAIVGTAGNDVVNGSVVLAAGVSATTSTFTTADKIASGAGTDTLNLTIEGEISSTGGADNYNAPAADITGVESVFIRQLATDGAGGPGSVTFNAGNAPGVTAVWSDRSTGDKLVVTNLATGATVGINGNGVAVNARGVDASYVATATAANIAVAGGSANTGAVTINGGAGLTSATLTSTNGTNALGGVAFTNTAANVVKTFTVDAQSNVTTGNITGLGTVATIAVKGAGTANIGTLQATNVTVLDASANTGGVTAVLNGVQTLKVTGGTGNDTFTAGAVLTTGSVDAGAGTGDKLIVSDSTFVATAALAAKYTNFETLQVGVADTAAVTQDVSLLSGITSIVINDGATGATGVTNLSAAQAAAVTILAGNSASGAITIGVKDATNPGQLDTVKLALTTTTTTAGVAAATPINLSGIVLAGVESLELTGNGTTKALTGAVTLTTTAATDLSSIKLGTIGDNNILTVGSITAANLNVDASASSGAVTINAFGYNTTTGASLTGGSGNDIILGSAKTDVINGGAGNDRIIGDASAEVQTFTITTKADVTGSLTVSVLGTAVAVAGAGDLDVAATAGRIVAAINADATIGATGQVVASNIAGAITLTYNATMGNVISAVGVAAVGGNGVVSGAVTTTTQGALNTASDILTGGAGKDAFHLSFGAVSTTDTIKDLDLGTSVVAGQVDTLVLNGTKAVGVVTLTAAQQTAVTAAVDLAAAADLMLKTGGAVDAAGATATFTYGTDTYLLYSGDATTNNGFQAGADILVKITGFVGTLDASDIVLVG